MKLLDIKIDGFGKLTDRYINFDDKLNIVFGENEAGKSTLHTLVRAMLFGMKRARGIEAQTDTYMHYKPWSKAPYRAELRVSYDGKTYRIVRDFDASPTEAVIYDESVNKELDDSEELLKEMLGGMNERSYDNSISIGQLKCASDEAMAGELKSFILNMDSTGNKSLNASNAKAFLHKQREELEQRLTPDTGRLINVNIAEINSLEEEMNKPEYINKIKELSDEIEKLSGTKDGEDYLKKNSFDNSESIDSYTGRMHSAYGEFAKEDNEGKKKRSPILITIMLVLMLLSIGAGVWAYLSNKIFLLYVFGMVAVIALILFIVFNSIRNDAKARLVKKENAASEYLKKLTEDESVTEENLQAANERIKCLKNIAIATEDRQKQYEIQNQLMQKIRRLKALKEQTARLKEDHERNKEISFNIEAIDIALETIDELAAKMKDSFGVHLNKEASAYISAITDGAYTSMSIDDDLGVYLNTKDRMVPIEQVSSGTSDQIYLAVRLACAKLMQKTKEALPLIFDDSFVNYDDGRLKAALTWIVKAYSGQIIIFTCQERESKILDDESIGYNKIEL